MVAKARRDIDRGIMVPGAWYGRFPDLKRVPDPPGPERPSMAQLQSWALDDGGCEATDGCWVEPDGWCEHAHLSWLLYLGMI